MNQFDKSARDNPLFCDSMVGRRSHNQSNGNRAQMQEPFHWFQILKAIVESRNQLKTKDGLNTRKHHSCFLNDCSGLLFQAGRVGFCTMVFSGHIGFFASSRLVPRLRCFIPIGRCARKPWRLERADSMLFIAIVGCQIAHARGNGCNGERASTG